MKEILTTKDFAFSQEEFHIHQTDKKGVYKTQPVPKNISKYYNFENYISHKTNKKSIIDKVYSVAQKVNIAYKKRIVLKYVKNGNLLEIGAGLGEFAKKMKSNFNVIAYEPLLKNHENEITWINDLESIEDNTINVICLWHVLEHIENIDSIKKILSRKIKNNGHIIIALPNYKSFDAIHYKEYWAAWDVPRHIWHFDEIGIKQTFEEFEFINMHPMLLDSFYISMMSESYKKGRLKLVKGIWNGMVSNIHGLWKKNYSSQIYVFKNQNKTI